MQTITEILEATRGSRDPAALMAETLGQCLSRSNGNGGRNTYLWQDAAWSERELRRVIERTVAQRSGQEGSTEPAMLVPGIPVSLKDCFDLAGTRTTQGSRFYAEHSEVATVDSWVAARLRAMGAVLTGKTHLHALAYGITGENRDYGDCVQPRDAKLLTGGSSSGAVASVQEGSALAAIGTDTGGSVRVPAALCGLVGYRSSLGWGDWQGGGHLAESFDTIGWLFRHLEDAPLLAQLFTENRKTNDDVPLARFAFVGGKFLHDTEPEVVQALAICIAEMRSLGMAGTEIDVAWWEGGQEIFAAIQAWEAARIHAGYYREFEAPIRQRLEWGASISSAEIAELRKKHEGFRARMDELLAEHTLVLLPCAPVGKLRVGEDHTTIRPRLLRYTAPASLGGLPALAVPFAVGGVQILARHGDDARLMRLATAMGKARRLAASQ